MAQSKSAKGDVVHVVDKDGNHHIGVEVEGIFVPFASADAVQVADRVAAGKSPEAQSAQSSSSSEGDE